MSFKINNPLRYTDPGKKLPKNPYPGNTTAGLESVQSFKIPAFLGIENTLKKDKATVERFGDNARISADAKKRINTFNSASKKAPVTPYKAGGGVTRNDSSSSSVPGFQPPAKTKKTKSADEESRRDFTSNLKNQKTKEKTKKDLTPENNKTTTKTTTAKRTTYNNKNLGKQDQFIEKDKNKQEFVPSAKKTNVKKETPKDNSRKAIRQRKTADKAAGVSKSQMRANKAKSKSEAFMAKAKASKDPSMRAQLKRKSDRLAKRAERKGGSPAKAVGDPKDPKKKYGKVTVKKEKKGNTTTITATRPYSTTKGKKTYKQFEKEGGNVAAAKKFNKGSDTKSITVVDKKQIGAKKLSATPKPKISSAKLSVDKDYGSFTFGSNARNMKSGGHSTYGRTAAGKTTKHSQSYTESPKKPMSGKDNIAKSRKITARENQLMKSDLYNQKYHPMKNKKEFDTHLGNIEKFEKRKNDKKFANKKITDKRSVELNAKKDALKARQDATRAKRAKNKK